MRSRNMRGSAYKIYFRITHRGNLFIRRQPAPCLVLRSAWSQRQVLNTSHSFHPVQVAQTQYTLSLFFVGEQLLSARLNRSLLLKYCALKLILPSCSLFLEVAQICAYPVSTNSPLLALVPIFQHFSWNNFHYLNFQSQS